MSPGAWKQIPMLGEVRVVEEKVEQSPILGMPLSSLGPMELGVREDPTA